jgi:hypothetical protein
MFSTPAPIHLKCSFSVQQAFLKQQTCVSGPTNYTHDLESLRTACNLNRTLRPHAFAGNEQPENMFACDNATRLAINCSNTLLLCFSTSELTSAGSNFITLLH